MKSDILKGIEQHKFTPFFTKWTYLVNRRIIAIIINSIHDKLSRVNLLISQSRKLENKVRYLF